MNKIDTGSISFYTIQMLGLTATSEIRKIVVCGFMLFTTDIEKKHIYFHISSGKTLGAPFANSNLGFTVFFSHSRSFFHPSILCLNSFFLSVFSQTHRTVSFYTTRNLKAKISQCRHLRCSAKKFPSHLTRKKKNPNCLGSVTNMGDDCIYHDFSTGNHAHLLFT